MFTAALKVITRRNVLNQLDVDVGMLLKHINLIPGQHGGLVVITVVSQ